MDVGKTKLESQGRQNSVIEETQVGTETPYGACNSIIVCRVLTAFGMAKTYLIHFLLSNTCIIDSTFYIYLPFFLKFTNFLSAVFPVSTACTFCSPALMRVLFLSATRRDRTLFFFSASLPAGPGCGGNKRSWAAFKLLCQSGQETGAIVKSGY